MKYRLSGVTNQPYNLYHHTINEMMTDYDNKVIDLDFVNSDYNKDTCVIVTEINGDQKLLSELIGRFTLKGFKVETVQ